MKALKGLLIYIGIVLAILLGIAILLFAGMYFFPSFRIMGIGVIHGSDKQTGKLLDLSDAYTYSSIELNISTKKFAVDVDVSDSASIEYSFNRDVFGIAYDTTEYKLLKDVTSDGDILKLSIIVTEPDGLISNSSSFVKISVPKSLTYSLLINTTTGDVNVGGSGEMNNLKNVTIGTTTGKFNLTGVSDNEDGSDKSLNLNSLNLSTSKGYFDLTQVNNLTVNNTIKLEGNNGTIVFDKVNGSFNITGKGLKIDANEITTGYNGFKFISENGFFDINKITTPTGAENTIVTENCDVKIDEISGRTAIVTTYGNISIGTLNDYATLKSEHGNVNIIKAKGDLSVNTNFGNIKVSSYERGARFVSTRGDIEVYGTGDYIQGVSTVIENTDGKIYVENKINQLLVKTYGSSKVEITYKEIKGGLTNVMDVFQHKVDLYKNSSAVIYMPTQNYDTPFKFIAKGNIDGVISGLIPEYGGDNVKSSEEFQYFPSAAFKDDEKCRQSCYFEFYGTITFASWLNY